MRVCIFVLALWSFLLSANSQTLPDRLTNSLNMVFVRVPETRVWFSIWQTRIRDYGVFVQEGHWGRLWPERPYFIQGPTHPVVNVSWEDAKGFCIWLTQKELALGLITSNQVYRLPTDLEWSQAVGLPKETGKTAQNRSGGFSGYYPWVTLKAGDVRPPVSKGAGNFSGKSDGFAFTAPVGSFKPNSLGIYDLGGNVFEWCIDFADDGRRHVLRGCSWLNAPRQSSDREYTLPDDLAGNFGFRCVFTDVPGTP
jgi:formylglycine-generating enzyme required for sulfatase activity